MSRISFFHREQIGRGTTLLWGVTPFATVKKACRAIKSHLALGTHSQYQSGSLLPQDFFYFFFFFHLQVGTTMFDPNFLTVGSFFNYRFTVYVCACVWVCMSIWFTTQVQVLPEPEEGIRSPEVEPPRESWAHQSAASVLTPEPSYSGPFWWSLKRKGIKKVLK